MNIFVGNLSPTVEDNDLMTLFSEHGKVNSVKIIRDMFTRQSKGFGFVEMPTSGEAQKAMDTLNLFELKGKKITVNEARPKTDSKGGGRRSSSSSSGGGGGGYRGGRR